MSISVQVLIIDEIDQFSMVSAEMLYMLDCQPQAVRDSSKPFGGLQIILAGDFFQCARSQICSALLRHHSSVAFTRHSDLKIGPACGIIDVKPCPRSMHEVSAWTFQATVSHSQQCQHLIITCLLQAVPN